MPVSSIAHSIPLREYYLGGAPAASAVFYESFPRDQITTDGAIGATTLITAVAVALYAGDVITKISCCVGATASGTPTRSYAVLYSGATVPLLLAQSTDTAGAAVPANTVYSGTLTTAYTVPTTGLYWAGFIFAATTPPTLLSKVTNVNATAAAALNTLIGGTAVNGVAVTATGSGTATAPATMASITQIAVMPYVLLQ